MPGILNEPSCRARGVPHGSGLPDQDRIVGSLDYEKGCSCCIFPQTSKNVQHAYSLINVVDMPFYED